MRSFSALVLALSFILASCGGNSGESGVITGKLSGVEEGTQIVIKSFKKGALIPVGECTTDVNGEFSLTPDNGLKRGYHQLMIDKRRPVVLITDSTESPRVEADIVEGKGYLLGANISGSSSSEKLSKYYNYLMPLQDSIQALQRKMRISSSEERPAVEQAMLSIVDDLEAWTLEFVKNNEGDASTLAALENLNPKTQGSVFKSVLKSVESELSSTHYYQMLEEKYKSSKKPRTIKNQPPPKTKRKNGKYGVGDEAPDIVMDDPNGVTRRLSDLKGKVVLIDFWASWCGPCRRENPHVVHAYEKYNAKGFEIFSVSLDSDKNRWVSAIEQDSLVWPNHVSDLQGWKNQASRGYGISSIPHTVLVGKDGVIIGTHLRGAALDAELKKIFGE